MAVLKNKDAITLNKEERMEKIKELKIELIKKSAPSGKGGKVRNKEIKKALARLLTQQHKEATLTQ